MVRGVSRGETLRQSADRAAGRDLAAFARNDLPRERVSGHLPFPFANCQPAQCGDFVRWRVGPVNCGNRQDAEGDFET